MVTWRLVFQGADADGRHLKSNCLCGLGAGPDLSMPSSISSPPCLGLLLCLALAHLATNYHLHQRQHHHLRHQDVVDLCSMDPLLRKPCLGLLLCLAVAHLEQIIFYISVSTIIFIVKMLLISSLWILRSLPPQIPIPIVILPFAGAQLESWESSLGAGCCCRSPVVSSLH